MTTLVLGENEVIAELIERRRALGQDRHDEVWNGIYHMAPQAHSRHGVVEVELVRALYPRAQAVGLLVSTAANIGDGTNNYRVPDLLVRDDGPDQVYLPTARLVVEVLSPDDETYAKFAFYAAHAVEEVLVADPDTRELVLWARTGIGATVTPAEGDVQGGYRQVAASGVLSVAVAELAAGIDWP